MLNSDPEERVQKNGDDRHCLEEYTEHRKVIVLVLVACQLASVRDYNTHANVVDQSTSEHTPHILIFIPIKVQ